MSSSCKRYFSIDYDSQLFYYSHSEDRKKISNPVRFKEILSAEQLPRPSQTNKKDAEYTFGFAVKTPTRTYELYTVTYNDAKHWVEGLNAGRDIANGVVASSSGDVEARDPFSGGMKKPPYEPSRSSVSTTADGSSDSGRSSEQDRDLSSYGGYSAGVAGPPPPRGPQPWQPPVASQPPVVSQPPVAYSSYSSSTAPSGTFRSGGYGAPVAPPVPAYRPPVAEPEPVPAAPEPENVDPFAALDALEELAGPLPEQSHFNSGVPPQQNIQGALLREAREMLSNKGKRPSLEATEALQRLRSNQTPSPLEDPKPASFAAPPAAPVALQAPAPTAVPLAPVLAPAYSMQPAASVATTYHNPAADNWDSDDENEAASRGLVAYQARPPCAPAELASAPVATTPQRVPAASKSAAATGLMPLTQAPTASRAAAPKNSDASGWDSDDDGLAQSKVLAPARHQSAHGVQHGVEASGWDSDDDSGRRAAKGSKAPMQSRSTCGAPQQAAESFVTAKTRPAAVNSARVKTGDDLDDLLGDVMAVDTTVSRGGGASHGLVPGFHCTKCDFQVLRIENYVWGSGVEYMFFRNNYPNVQKLRPQLVPRKDCCAYCCQCSWKSAESAAPLADVAEGLRWRSIGC
jgi:hypothetical protein